MSMLMQVVRPTEVFDVQNKVHRALFAQYIKTGQWTHCPVQFVASEPTQVDVGTMTRQVVEYYLAKEFDRGSKEGKPTQPEVAAVKPGSKGYKVVDV
jgi:hypothetical protein